MPRFRIELVLIAMLLLVGAGRPPAPDAACPQPGLLPDRGDGVVRLTCEGEGSPLTGAQPLLFGRGLDPGVADAAALQHLPGLGPVRSSALVASREQRALCRPADLLRVRGIGPHTLERLRPYLRFGGDPRCAAAGTPSLPSDPGGESG